MRHGKAEPAGRTDYERELADRGHDDSQDAGGWLAGQGFVPDVAMVSAAHRTVGTWESVAAGGGFDLEPPCPRRCTAPARRPPSTWCARRRTT